MVTIANSRCGDGVFLPASLGNFLGCHRRNTFSTQTHDRSLQRRQGVGGHLPRSCFDQTSRRVKDVLPGQIYLLIQYICGQQQFYVLVNEFIRIQISSSSSPDHSACYDICTYLEKWVCFYLSFFFNNTTEFYRYEYPPPDGNILTNIVNALIAVPRFYTQV